MNHLDNIKKTYDLLLRRPKNGDRIKVFYHIKTQHDDTPWVHKDTEGEVFESDSMGFCVREDTGRIVIFPDMHNAQDNRVLSYWCDGHLYKAFDFIIKKR